MGKQEVVAETAASVQNAQSQALVDGLNTVWDKAQAAVSAGTGSFTQEQMDQAKADAKAEAAQSIADLQKSLADTQQALADMTAKEQLEESTVADVNDKMAQMQSKVAAAIAALNS